MKNILFLLLLLQYSCANYHYKNYKSEETFIAVIYYMKQFFVYEINEDDMSLNDVEFFKKLQTKKATIIFRLTEEQYWSMLQKGTKFSTLQQNSESEDYYIDFYVVFAKAKLKKIDKDKREEDYKLRKMYDLNTDCFNFKIKYIVANLMFEKLEVFKEKKINSRCSI